MKVTVVPAQVTTVEDRIAGSLSFSQLLLLAAPVFGGSALFVILPPVFHGALYKFVVIGVLFILCSLLAVRIKGKILLLWILVLARYNLRPRYYVFNKRSLHGREEYQNKFIADLEDEPVTISNRVRDKLSLSPAQVIALQDIIENPAANVAFETNKKGKLYVRITEVKPQV